MDPAKLTFTHVFIKHDNRTDAQMSTLMNTLSQQLTQHNVAYKDAIKYGERFPFALEYNQETEQEVAVYFGKEMAQSLYQLDVNDTQWQGPPCFFWGIYSSFKVAIFLLLF